MILTKKNLYIFFLIVVTSILTTRGINTAFIFLLFISFLLIQKQYKKLFNRQVLIGTILFTIMIMPLVIFTLKFGTVGLKCNHLPLSIPHSLTPTLSYCKEVRNV